MRRDRAAGPGTGPLAAGAAAQEPKPKRGLFGFGKKRAAEPTPAAGAQPGYATGEQGYARDQGYPREAPAAGAGNAQGGAWAGSRLTQEEEANRANLAGRVSTLLALLLMAVDALLCVAIDAVG